MERKTTTVMDGTSATPNKVMEAITRNKHATNGANGGLAHGEATVDSPTIQEVNAKETDSSPVGRIDTALPLEKITGTAPEGETTHVHPATGDTVAVHEREIARRIVVTIDTVVVIDPVLTLTRQERPTGHPSPKLPFRTVGMHQPEEATVVPTRTKGTVTNHPQGQATLRHRC